MKMRPWQLTGTVLMVAGWLVPSVLALLWTPPWVGIPLAVACGMLVFAQVVGARAAERRQERWYRGKCVRCGYDMRASPARCPECGRLASTEADA